MNTSYTVLKHHFNKLIMGGYPNNTGMEPLRDTYEEAFDKKIGLYDIYETAINNQHNPISYICTLIGPDSDEEIPGGILWQDNGRNSIVSVNVFSENILKGNMEDKEADEYIISVYKAMHNVIQMDRFYKSDTIAKNNPYMIAIKCIPLWFTFFHIQDCMPRLYNRKVFKNLIEKYLYSGSLSDDIISNIENSKYSEDLNKIYNSITYGNKIKLLR